MESLYAIHTSSISLYLANDLAFSLSGSSKYSTAHPSFLSKPPFAIPYLQLQLYCGTEWLHG